MVNEPSNNADGINNNLKEEANYTSTFASFSDIKAELDKLSKNVDKFCDLKAENYKEAKEWRDLFEKHEELIKDISDFSSKISTPNERKQLDDLTEKLIVAYNDFISKFYVWHTNFSEDIENKLEKQQSTNLTVFSIFMTLLTFLFSNVLVLTKTEFKIKNIVLINLILLLAIFVIFVLINLFFGFSKRKNDTKLLIGIKYGGLIIIIVCIIILIGVVLNSEL